jgi:hypothetical protein
MNLVDAATGVDVFCDRESITPMHAIAVIAAIATSLKTYLAKSLPPRTGTLELGSPSM